VIGHAVMTAKLRGAWVAAFAAMTNVWIGVRSGHMSRFAALALFVALPFLSGPSRADTPKPRVHIVSFALWGDQDLFRREASAAATIAAVQYRNSGQLIVRANTKTKNAARIPDLRDTLHGLASSIDVQEDILFLFLTSHGAQDGLGVKTHDSDRVFPLSPERLGGMLRVAGIRHRVVVISACYSGVFANEIADEHTLVITAADAEHSSFGCNDDNPGNWTYFGQAFFAENFSKGLSLDETFRNAKASVGEREKAEKLEGSNPQMKGGAAVRRQLARIQ
jgi:Peptidase C13 family